MNGDKLTVSPDPWGIFGTRSGWRGNVISVDGTSTAPFDEPDLDEVLFQGQTEDGWDGFVAAVFRLKDGRIVAYQTFWGPTGDGFNEDAYGGDADVYVGRDLNLLIRSALTDAGRRLAGIPDDLWEPRKDT
ncbi:MAG: hypothetical protein ACRDGM_19160 [bacterium]